MSTTNSPRHTISTGSRVSTAVLFMMTGLVRVQIIPMEAILNFALIRFLRGRGREDDSSTATDRNTSPVLQDEQGKCSQIYGLTQIKNLDPIDPIDWSNWLTLMAFSIRITELYLRPFRSDNYVTSFSWLALASRSLGLLERQGLSAFNSAENLTLILYESHKVTS